MQSLDNVIKMNQRMYALQHKGQIIPIEKLNMGVGRHINNDIVVNSINVSRFHLKIHLIDDYVFIEDLKTVNGTYIAKEKILSERLTNVKVNEIIGIGCTPNEDEECAIRLIQFMVPVEATEHVSSSTTDIVSAISRTENFIPSGSIQPPPPIINVNLKIESPTADATKIVEVMNELIKNHKRIGSTQFNLDHMSNESSKVGDGMLTKYLKSENLELEQHWETTSNCGEVEKASTSENQVSEHVREKNGYSSSHADFAKGYRKKSTVKDDSNCRHSEKPASLNSSQKESKNGKREGKNSTSSSRKSRNDKSSKQDEKCTMEKLDTTSSSSKSKDGKPNSSSKISFESEDTTEKSFKNEKKKLSSRGAKKIRKTSDNENYIPSTTTIENQTKSHQNDAETSQKMKKLSANRTKTKAEPKLQVDSNLEVKPVIEIPVKSKQILPVSSTVLEAVGSRKKSNYNIDLTEPATSDVIDLVEDVQQPTSMRIDFVNLVDDEPVSTTISRDLEQQMKNSVPIISNDLTNISSDEEPDIKSRIPAEVNYSKLDEIISLDSDDEDFPSSQMFDATLVDSVPDYAPTFQMMYEFDVKEESEEQPQMLHCNDSTWFEPLSQGNYIEEKMVPKTVDVLDYPIGSPELPVSSLGSSDCENESEMLSNDIVKQYGLKSCSVVLKRIPDCERVVKLLKRKSTESIEEDEEDEEDVMPHTKPVAEKSPFRQDDMHSPTPDRSPPIISPIQRKKRKTNSNPVEMYFNVNNVKKKERLKLYENPTLCILQKQHIKNVKAARKEKLKELTMKTTINREPDAIVKPKVIPVAKVTNKNRNTMLVEALVNEKQQANKILKEVPISAAMSNIKLTELVENTSTFNQVSKWDASSDGELIDNILRTTSETRKDAMLMKNPPEEPEKQKLDVATGRKRNEISQSKGYLSLITEKKTPTKKKVKFDLHTKSKEINYDLKERSIKRQTMSSVRWLDQMIHDCANELDAAMAHMCSWNVRWLKEQVMYQTPPPVYKMSSENKENQLADNSIEKYRENLKYLLFLQLWYALFNEWNTAGNNIIPNTQFSNEKNVFNFTIEKVDNNQDKNTLVITATRMLGETNNSSVENEINIGQVVIINHQFTCQGSQTLKKTMIFAYVSNVMIIVGANSRLLERVWIKTARNKFDIVPGPIKLKVVHYMRKHLIPFQALALLSKSPLTNCILNPPTLVPVPFIKWGEELFTEQKFLSSSQKTAIVKCLNAIYSKISRLCVIDGAPGTGKSQIIVSLMRELYSSSRKFELPENLKILIITAFDNNADDLCYRLQKVSGTSVNFLRYGNDRGAHQIVKSCSLQKRIDDLVKSDSNNELIDLIVEKNNLQAQIRSTQLVLTSGTNEKQADAKSKLANWQRELDDLNSENSKVIERLKIQAARRISLANADVIITSLQSCWSNSFEHDFLPNQKNAGDVEKFTVCIMDDANLIPEQYVLSPIMLMVSTLILIGDSKNRTRTGSLFDKSRQTFKMVAPNELVTLDVGFRLHSMLQIWINEQFATCVKKFPQKLDKLKPLIVMDFSPQNSSNQRVFDDVEMTYFFIDLILEIDRIEEKEIRLGVIVFDEEQKEHIKSFLIESRIFDRRKVVVDKVEEFSGREQNIIVVYLPYNRSFNDSFLYNIVTRAQKSLILCGYFGHENLKRVPAVISLIQYAKRYNCYVRSMDRTNLSSSLLLENLG